MHGVPVPTPTADWSEVVEILNSQTVPNYQVFVTFKTTDISNLTGSTSREIIFVDRTPPVLLFGQGEANIVVEASKTVNFSDPWVTAYDAVDKNEVKVERSGTVVMSNPGWDVFKCLCKRFLCFNLI